MSDASDPKSKPEPSTQDVMLLHGRTDDGAGYRAVRARRGRVELAEVRPAKEGQPLQGNELVSLHPRPEFPLVCDVEVLFRREDTDDGDSPGSSAGAAHAGPARFSSRSYRANWGRTFRTPRKKGNNEPAN